MGACNGINRRALSEASIVSVCFELCCTRTRQTARSLSSNIIMLYFVFLLVVVHEVEQVDLVDVGIFLDVTIHHFLEQLINDDLLLFIRLDVELTDETMETCCNFFEVGVHESKIARDGANLEYNVTPHIAHFDEPWHGLLDVDISEHLP